MTTGRATAWYGFAPRKLTRMSMTLMTMVIDLKTQRCRLTRIKGRVRNCHATLVKDIRIMLNRLFAMTMLQSSNSTLQDIQTFQKAMQKNAMALCFPQATFCIRSGVLDNK